jgi:hypothetical protein
MSQASYARTRSEIGAASCAYVSIVRQLADSGESSDLVHESVPEHERESDAHNEPHDLRSVQIGAISNESTRNTLQGNLPILVMYIRVQYRTNQRVIRYKATCRF